MFLTSHPAQVLFDKPGELPVPTAALGGGGPGSKTPAKPPPSAAAAIYASPMLSRMSYTPPSAAAPVFGGPSSRYARCHKFVEG